MLKVLFYVEPLIERGKPFWKSNWVTDFSRRIADALNREQGRELDIVVLTSEAIASIIPMTFEGRVISLKQNEALGPFNDFLEAGIRWNTGSVSEHETSQITEIIGNKLGNFVPDFVFTFSTAPFLNTMFPQALIQTVEYGVFSRNPFPETFFFDPYGLSGGGLGKCPAIIFENDMGSFNISSNDLQNAEKIKAKVRETLRQRSPFHQLEKNLRQNFSRLLLVPLQFSNHYVFSGESNYKSQFDFARDILERSPVDCAVIFTEHDEEPIFDSETLRYFRERFPNFVFHEDFKRHSFAGQLLAGHVDIIATVSSTVGLQALLWDLPLISLGSNYAQFISDSARIEDALDIQVQAPEKRKDFLSWLFKYYYVPDLMLDTGVNFSKLMNEKLENYRAKVRPENNFPEIMPRLYSVEALLDRIGSAPAASPRKLAEDIERENLAILDNLKDELSKSLARQKESVDHAASLQNRIYKMETSFSWKLTKPLRRLKHLAQKILSL